ncbi:unnamed protein product [Cylicocyclus nassatus]|uniref:EGF-like domain-containing protein n=1 Tax=Cylicocyclus nassatus TaxID=53992 RepID=A0AA36MA79_CYLNA|nr:unnamed protein product [Cylicocyclus nassatus]
MRTLAVLHAALVVFVMAERPKQKDSTGAFLVKISDIPVGSCGSDSYFGLGMMNGSLEECERWKLTDPAAMREYEEYKCKHLRVHAHMVGGKCVCEPKWKGPICNEFEGCPEGHALHGKVCTANVCQHGGTLAVGRKEIECICEVPWDGRYCERLACWRKTKFGQDKRFRNQVDHCVCTQYFEGDNCDKIIGCMNGGELQNHKCLCKEGYGGEVCEKKCHKGQLTCSTCSVMATMTVVISIAATVFRQ